MDKLKEKNLQDFINNVQALKSKDENTFQNILYLMKGIQIGQELKNKCTSL